MPRDYLKALIDLRDEALEELRKSPMNYAFVVLDNAIVDLGGERAVIDRRSVDGTPIGITPKEAVEKRVIAKRETGTRLTKPFKYGDAVESILLEIGFPMPLVDILMSIEQRGVIIGGVDKLANLRSTLSYDKRFVSIRSNNRHCWWLSDIKVPDV